MQSTYSVHITPAERRWLIVVASALVLLAFAPFIYVALSPPSDWQFMGVLNNPLDGATYIAKMVEGYQGFWLIHFQHTPETHAGALLQIIYPLLGHVSGVFSLPQVLVFHVARVGAALFMYIAIYQLAASIWTRVRSRRIFFIIACLGAGFGWILGTLTGETHYPDLSIPEIFPLYSTFMNVHFPLTLGCLALIASAFINAFRPGSEEDRSQEINVALVAVLSLILALLYPQTLVPIGVALGIYVVITAIQRRGIPRGTLGWLLALAVPAIPLAAYYTLVVTYNPAMAEWNRQNITASPNPLVMILGLGIPLFIAVPGIVRAVRRFEQDGDRFMLLWLAAMVVLMYLPTHIQRRFAAGMMIPIAYFATRALEDFWFRRIKPQWQSYLFVALVPFMAVSQIFSLFIPAILARTPEKAAPLMLERDYLGAFEWLDTHTSASDVVLASPNVSLWIPAWAGSRVVYGHPFETLYADQKKSDVLTWYANSTSTGCDALIQQWSVRFVVVGPEEKKLGPADCANTLNPVVGIGDITIYSP
jgi:hypothetical protein